MKHVRSAVFPWPFLVVIAVLLATLAYFPLTRIMASSPAVIRQTVGKPLVNLRNPLQVRVSYTGPADVVARLNAGATPTALAGADFDNDGAEDLVAGYSTANGGVVTLQRGNPDAFAPKDTTLYRKALQGIVAPTFMPKAAVYAVPESPDFLATGDFNRDGAQDLLVGAHGGGLYLLAGDGHGSLRAAQSIFLEGRVLAVDTTGDGHVAISLDSPGSPQLAVLAPGVRGFTILATFPLPARGDAVAWGRFGGKGDLAVGAGNNVVVIYGALGANPQTETVNLAYQVQALTVGDFIWDRAGRLEISVLGDDGAIHILQHGILDTRPLTAADIRGRRAALRAQAIQLAKNPTVIGHWIEARQFSASVSTSSGAVRPMLSSRLAGSSLMVVDAGQNRLNILDASGKAASAQTTIEFSGTPVAAHATAPKLNGSRSLVVLNTSQLAPVAMDQAPDPTFNVTTTVDEDDANACNNTSVLTGAGSDGVLSLREAVCEANNNGAATSVINVPAGTYNLSLNTGGETGELQVGTTSGANISIVGSGTPSNTIIRQTTGVDRIIEQDFPIVGGVTMAISNVTLSSGNCTTGTDCAFGGGAVLGGSAASSADDVTFNNVVFDSNSSGTAPGGAVILGSAGTYTVSSSTFSNNTAGTSGGGIFYSNNPSGGNLSVTNSTFTNDQATSQGGGGIFSAPGDGNSASVTGSTFTGNNGGPQGGAVSGALGLTIAFSRITGNTATSGSGVFEAGGDTADVFTGTNNWWGCNGGPGTTGCDSVTFGGGSGSVTFDPWIALSNTASPGTINVSDTTTLTASFLQDNHGTAISVTNLGALLGLPITFNNAVNGTLSAAQTTIQSTGTATATFTATASGTGHADAVVDHGTATADITIQGATLTAPSISKSFGADTMPVNGTSSLSFTITNPNASSALHGVAFSDTLPAGLVVATPNGLTGSCGGGTITAVAASGSVSLSGATLAGGANCTFSVNVQGTTAGDKDNTTGSVTATDGGGLTGNVGTAGITVLSAPSISKSFGAASIALNASTTLSFTVSNANADTSLTGVAFTDTLPAGLVVSTPNGLTGSCGGGTITATAGSGSVSLAGATLAAAGSCTFSVMLPARRPAQRTTA